MTTIVAGVGNPYELLVQSVTDYAIYMLDPGGRVTSWNAGARRFKGYEPSEIIGQHFSRFYTEEDRAAGVPTRALATAEADGRFEAEGWRVRKDGTRFWANVVVDAIRSPAGELLGFAKVTRDLTERREADEALRRSEEQFRVLVQGITDYAIYMLDPTGIVSSWNPGAQRFKGYVPDEIIGEHFSRFYTDEDRASGLPARALATAEREGRFEAEGWRVRKDGTRFWAHVVLDALRSPAGDHIGFAKITRDLTERREAQRALEQAQEAFFQSQKMDAIGKLTGGVAHDFNNLLAAIIGSLDLANRRLAQGGKIEHLLENALKAAERGASLTQRMLAFARKQELKMETVDISTLVRGMADLLQRSMSGSVSIVTRFPLILRPVHADPAQLELALLNLSVNARDAMPDGGEILITAREEQVRGNRAGELASGRYVCLSVVDTGQGMDEDTLSRAMEPFFTTKGVGKGTGLGLSMVHGFAEQCGGRLVITSKVGEGTTAEIWLKVAETKTSGSEEAEPAPAAMAPQVAPLTILAVDDDALVLTNTAAILDDMGHRVVTANSGKEALSRLAAQPIDLLLTDFAMPDMNGAQLARAAQAGWPGLAVLLVSGFAEMPAELGDDWNKLAKPFRPDELAQAIARAARPHTSGQVLAFRR